MGKRRDLDGVIGGDIEEGEGRRDFSDVELIGATNHEVEERRGKRR